MNLNDWKLTEQATMIVDDGEKELEYRFTFGTLTSFAEAKFNRQRLRILDRLEEEYGKYDEADEDTQSDIDTLWVLMIKHAAVMATMQRVETRSGDDDFVSAELPEGWGDGYWFAMNGPAGVLDHLMSATMSAGNSARVFGLSLAGDDEGGEKKAIRLFVNGKKSST